jgi:hypothetical protein
MATYNAPIKDLSVFDSIVFPPDSNTDLTQDEADSRYLRYSIGQGTETIPSVSITNSATLGSAIIGGATTMTGDITLNKSSGTQNINCSAPAGLELKTNAFSQPVAFTTQSSSGVYGSTMAIQANNNPRAQYYVKEFSLVDNTNNAYKSTVSFSAGGDSIIANTSTAGNGNIEFKTDASTAGAGAITLRTKDGTPSTTTGLIMNGTALQSSTAGGSSGSHLCITLNGTLYKIALLNA